MEFDGNQSLNLQLSDLQETNTEVIGTVVTYNYNSSNVVNTSTRSSVQCGSIIDTIKMSLTSTDVIGKLSLAIDDIANERTTLGSQQSRLQQTRSGLLAYEDNIWAAESKIRGIDMVRKSALFARSQLLTQIGSDMLAQANQIASQAL